MKPKTQHQLNNPDLVEMKTNIVPDNKEIIIFLVDDDPLYLKSLEFEFCQNPNLKIITFLKSQACIEKLFLNPDVIILDYILTIPHEKALDGLQTLIKIKETLPNTQVIMLSALESVEVATNSLKLGASDYVVKNRNTFTHLKAHIKKHLGINSKEKELIVWDW
jgi:DNA-binding NarL/FixJ family response regulator